MPPSARQQAGGRRQYGGRVGSDLTANNPSYVVQRRRSAIGQRLQRLDEYSSDTPSPAPLNRFQLNQLWRVSALRNARRPPTTTVTLIQWLARGEIKFRDAAKHAAMAGSGHNDDCSRTATWIASITADDIPAKEREINSVREAIRQVVASLLGSDGIEALLHAVL